jgi:predicted ester cyclase
VPDAKRWEEAGWAGTCCSGRSEPGTRRTGAGRRWCCCILAGPDSRAFEGNLTGLAERFRVYRPDRRGHGRTPDVAGPISDNQMATDTIAFLEQVVGGPAYLVGHSDGAPVALLAALKRPDLVRRLAGVRLGGLPPRRLGSGRDRPGRGDHRLLRRLPRRGLPRSQLAVLPGCGHGLFADKPELCNRFEEIWNAKDLAVADELMAQDYLEHALAPFGQAEPGRVNGPAAMRETAGWLLAQFPDLHMTIEAMVAEGDLVAVRVLSEGTNLGPLNGVVPPTGKRFAARQTHWFRVEGGRLVEHWATREDLVAMLQLGVIQPPGRPPA